MTNNMIILMERVQLMKAGKIGTTGRYVEVEHKDGTVEKLAEPEEIHTYQHWKALGYQVKRGEKAAASFMIWKAGKSKEEPNPEAPEENLEKMKMFMKLAHFFTMAQVEPIKKVISA